MKLPRITTQEAGAAVLIMGRMIPFFPRDELTREFIARSVQTFVAGPDELNWLVNIAVNVLHDWKGLAELRGLYCSRYRPLDKIEAVSGTIGFRCQDVAEQAEKEFFEREARESERKLAEYRKEAKQLPAAEREANEAVLIQAQELAEVKRLT